MDVELYVVNVEAFVYHRGRYLMMVRGAAEEIAPGTLTPPGGKVEGVRRDQDVLEATLRREVFEESGVEVDPEVAYVESHAFEGGGFVIVDIVFLARYRGGEPRPRDEEEVASLEWLTAEEILADARTMAWTKASLDRVEGVRRERGW